MQVRGETSHIHALLTINMRVTYIWGDKRVLFDVSDEGAFEETKQEEVKEKKIEEKVDDAVTDEEDDETTVEV